VTPVIVGAGFTVTVVAPNIVESWTEVALIVALPVPDGVKTPAEIIAPVVADHVTAEL
jgi:uncharacterized protein YcfJ